MPARMYSVMKQFDYLVSAKTESCVLEKGQNENKNGFHEI